MNSMLALSTLNNYNATHDQALTFVRIVEVDVDSVSGPYPAEVKMADIIANHFWIARQARPPEEFVPYELVVNFLAVREHTALENEGKPKNKWKESPPLTDAVKEQAAQLDKDLAEGLCEQLG
jgi:hypothetical protein